MLTDYELHLLGMMKVELSDGTGGQRPILYLCDGVLHPELFEGEFIVWRIGNPVPLILRS
jgi:hypothetical protein